MSPMLLIKNKALHPLHPLPHLPPPPRPLRPVEKDAKANDYYMIMIIFKCNFLKGSAIIFK